MKEKYHLLLEGVNDFKKKKEKVENTLLENNVAMKGITRYLVDLERTVKSLETGKSLLMETNKEIVSCSWQRTLSGGRITDKLHKHISAV